MRINARLDETRTQKLEYLLEATDSGISEVVRQAIDVYYEQVQERRPGAFEILSATGFIGSGEGPEDLSETYQRQLEQGWAAKHGHR